MTTMESLSMLGLSGQARAPTQGPGCGAVVGPPGAAEPASGEHAAFAASLRQLLGGMAARKASPGAAPEEPVATRPIEEGAREVEEGADGADAAGRPRTLKGAPASEVPAATAGAAIAPIPMSLDLFEGAASQEPALEPSQTGADDALSITAVARSTARNVPIVAAAAAVGPTATTATPAPNADEVEPSPAARLDTASAAGEATSPAPAAPPLAGPLADGRDGAPTADVAPRTVVSDVRDPRRESTAGPTPRSEEQPIDAVPHARVAALARADAQQGNRVAGGALSGAGPMRDADGETAGEPSPTQESAMPTAGAGDASGAARRSSDATPARPAQASARHSEVERPGRRQQGVPAEGAPEVHPGSAHATVVQWLHGSERVDEGQALQQAQRILVANLADDIHRLTFVGQSRAVLQLQPPDLGKLSIHLTMQDGGLAVEMVVESEAVKAIVESSLDQLRSALAQHGLATAGVFVQVGESAHRDTAQWQARRGRESRGAPPATDRIEGAAPPPAARPMGHGSTVDYRI